ncbi:MAG: tetratricopeptide repeat protein [Myxococcales bacterium]|nr:tetratricopeptide repeat protein [Myxococcales bacterium]
MRFSRTALALISLPGLLGVAGAAPPLPPTAPRAPDGYLVVPFENTSPVRQLDWMAPALATTVAEKLESHPRLRAVYGPAILEGSPQKLDEARVAVRARDAGARFVIAGSFGRPNWKAQVAVRVLEVSGDGVPQLKEIGTAEAIGESKALLDLLDDALLAALQRAGLGVEGETLAGLKRRPTRDLYAFTLYGRAQGLFHGLGGGSGAKQPDLPAAQKLLAKVLLIDPKFAEAHRLMGLIHLQRGERGKGAGQYAHALDIRPDYWAALVGLARLYRADNRRQPALELATKALAARPADIEMRFLVAQLEWEGGELDRALANLREVVAAQPRHVAARRVLAQVYAARGEIAELAEELGRVTDLAPDDTDARLDLGSALMRLGKSSDALGVYEEVLARHPRHVQALKFTGDLYRRVGEPEKAIAAYERVRHLAPEDPRPVFLLAGAYIDAGNDTKAEQTLLAAAEFHRRHVGEAWTDLGALAYKRGDLGTANWYLSRAVERAPTRPKAHFNYALVLNARKERERALAEVKIAADLDPEDAECLYLAGVIHLRLGRLDDARQAFEAALKRKPAHPDAMHNLALLIDLEKRYGSERSGVGSQ